MNSDLSYINLKDINLQEPTNIRNEKSTQFSCIYIELLTIDTDNAAIQILMLNLPPGANVYTDFICILRNSCLSDTERQSDAAAVG